MTTDKPPQLPEPFTALHLNALRRLLLASRGIAGSWKKLDNLREKLSDNQIQQFLSGTSYLTYFHQNEPVIKTIFHSIWNYMESSDSRINYLMNKEISYLYRSNLSTISEILGISEALDVVYSYTPDNIYSYTIDQQAYKSTITLRHFLNEHNNDKSHFQFVLEFDFGVWNSTGELVCHIYYTDMRNKFKRKATGRAIGFGNDLLIFAINTLNSEFFTIVCEDCRAGYSYRPLTGICLCKVDGIEPKLLNIDFETSSIYADTNEEIFESVFFVDD